ncbi:MAG: Xaa-Pro aminopeptidase [Candidatus Cloacimonadota bacterium]|jgi:Xaa-Pro aminopeptidase|nr:Xaa-Pro aminopeptidase [Candidatus Cloacimonadota bacterium]
MDIDLLQTRREKLAENLNNNEMLVIFAASEPTYPRYFLQEKNFFYLTNLEIPKAILLIAKSNNKTSINLFVERNDPTLTVWIGEKMSPQEAAEISGIKKVAFTDDFEKTFQALASNMKKCYFNYKKSSLEEPLDRAKQFISKIKDYFPALSYGSIDELMRPLRERKDEWEIEQLQTAIDATAKGIETIMKNAKMGMMEYELEALLNYEALSRGLHHMGFKSIVAAGHNAATLHYSDNNCEIGKDDLVLLDVGAACKNYSADISRTFPVSGKFTQRQRQVYAEVLNIQKTIIEMIKPGVTMKELNNKTVEMITASLHKLGLIKQDKEYKKYYMHSVGHHLGLDTHDIGRRDATLSAGMVITVEPGIYISEENIGVRIEDDILVTENGYKNLSAAIPKEIEEIEKD